MTNRRLIAAGLGVAALTAAAPAAAQYAYPGYSYGAPYGNAYGYNTNVHQMAAAQCTAAVQNRLYNRTNIGGILGAVLGTTAVQGRVLSITRINPNRSTIRVRGLATSGRMAYNPYGYGYYGATGYNYQADLNFKCDVDYRGRIRDIDITRRR